MFGLFVSWRRPSREQQNSCITNGGPFNYDPKYHCASRSDPDLRVDGFHVNRARVLLGSGPDTFSRAKDALLSWRHFGLDWAFVEPDTPVEKGVNFCVCTKQLIPWIMMPLQIAYVDNSSSSVNGQQLSKSGKGSFCFGSGTLHGHLLAGEERFSIKWDENDQVWYEIFSFSKPAHFLSALGYPYVRLQQKCFAKQSTRAFLKHVAGT